MKPRKIIHVDLDAFFCSVEELRRPELRQQAFAVGGRPDQRGVIASCSYPARRFGVHSAMPTAKALQLCPGLIVIAGDHAAYSRASQNVMAVFAKTSPLVEQISIDEAFLDVTDLPEPGLKIAALLQAQVRQATGLPCSLGVASNKLVAKIASDIGKKRHNGDGPPNAILEIPPGEEAAFLAGLPVEALWGVGPKTAQRLAELGILNIGQIAAFPENQLLARFGKNGYDLARHARGLDDRPVTLEHEVKSISEETTFDHDISSQEKLLETLHAQAERVGRNLRQSHLLAGTIRVKLRWPDFTTLTRQVTLTEPTDQDGVIFECARGLLLRNWMPGKPVRLLGVGVSGLSEVILQPGLWDSQVQRDRRLLDAVDQLHERFGDHSIELGYKIKHRPKKQAGTK